MRYGNEYWMGIKNAMLKNNISIDILSAKLNFTKQHMRLIANGNTSCSLKKARLIASAIGCPIGDFLQEFSETEQEILKKKIQEDFRKKVSIFFREYGKTAKELRETHGGKLSEWENVLEKKTFSPRVAAVWKRLQLVIS
jgi:transcriptional regulator with XRE-family HTH domain